MGYQEEKQRQLDIRYLKMATVWAENSYCVRRQVGALIVKNKMIISDGYNGTPSGFENVCEDEAGHTKPYVECAKLIIQSGIRRVVFCDDYHSSDGIELLRRVGIEVEKITLPPAR